MEHKNKIGDGTFVYITFDDQIQVNAPKDFNLKVFDFDSKNKKWEQVNNLKPINLNGNETILNSGNKSTILPIEINGRGLPSSGGRGRPFLLSLDS